MINLSSFKEFFRIISVGFDINWIGVYGMLVVCLDLGMWKIIGFDN